MAGVTRIERIKIPNRDRAWAPFHLCGINPRKAANNEMCQSIAQALSRGEITDAEFRHACVKLLILNPSLADKPRGTV